MERIGSETVYEGKIIDVRTDPDLLEVPAGKLDVEACHDSKSLIALHMLRAKP